jgi:2-aminoadipate transaminase
LYILSDLLIDPGDIVIASAPTYYVYAGTLTSMGAEVLSVPMDEQGMRTDLLEELLVDLDRKGRIERVKIIYEVTYYQNPSGLTLSTERRQHLVELARRFSRKHRILIIDDAAYREMRFDGPTWPGLKRFDPENRFVATCMTFSKSLSAGLKTGYAFLPDDLVDPFLQQKGNHDFGSCNFAQHVIHRAMRDGVYQRHVEKVREAYRGKRDATLEALQEYLGDLAGQVAWARPNGGMYVWLSLPECINTGRSHFLFRRCVQKGVLYVPGEYCYASSPVPTNKIRLSYGVQGPASIREGVKRLAEAVREALEKPAAASGPTARSQPAV